jgi:hypothetical protein
MEHVSSALRWPRQQGLGGSCAPSPTICPGAAPSCSILIWQPNKNRCGLPKCHLVGGATPLATLPPPNFQAFFLRFPANVATHTAIAVPPPTPQLVQISLAVMSQERCKDWAPQVGDPADVDLSARSRRDSVALPEFPRGDSFLRLAGFVKARADLWHTNITTSERALSSGSS